VGWATRERLRQMPHSRIESFLMSVFSLK